MSSLLKTKIVTKKSCHLYFSDEKMLPGSHPTHGVLGYPAESLKNLAKSEILPKKVVAYASVIKSLQNKIDFIESMADNGQRVINLFNHLL